MLESNVGTRETSDTQATCVTRETQDIQNTQEGTLVIVHRLYW